MLFSSAAVSAEGCRPSVAIMPYGHFVQEVDPSNWGGDPVL